MPADASARPPQASGAGRATDADLAASRTARTYRYDVFISHSPADADWVWDWLLPRLKAADLQVCIDQESFEPGAPVAEETERAIRESRRILAVMSPAWAAEDWADFETLLVHRRDPAAHWRRLIPLLLEPCDPSERISLLHWVDLSQPERREAQLARVIGAVQGTTLLPELRVDLFPEPRRRLWEGRWFAVAGISAVLSLVLLLGWILQRKA